MNFGPLELGMIEIKPPRPAPAAISAGVAITLTPPVITSTTTDPPATIVPPTTAPPAP